MIRRSSPRSLLRVLGAVSACALAACGVDPSLLSDGTSYTQVRPRVVVDGLISLSARTNGRLFVDEVLIHAPVAELRTGDRRDVDLLATDPVEPGPLVFRYGLDDTLRGAVFGGDRTWDLSSGTGSSKLAFGFEPLEGESDDVDRLGAQSGIDLSGLRGATAMIHGFVARDPSGPTPGEGGDLVASGDPDGAPGDSLGDLLSGDPDGAPGDSPRETTGGDPDGAPGRTPHDVFGGDPDGAPGRHGGVTAGGDPDGAPGKAGGVTAGGDPDGAPGRTTASGDPDGTPGDLGPNVDDTISGDPDGAPGRVHAASAPRFGGIPVSAGAAHEMVPFVIVLDSTFGFELPFASLPAPGKNGVLPIDVHVDADEVFTAELLRLLESRAAVDDGSGDEVVLAVESGGSAFGVAVTNATEAPSEPVPPKKLSISGDARDTTPDDETNPER